MYPLSGEKSFFCLNYKLILENFHEILNAAFFVLASSSFANVFAASQGSIVAPVEVYSAEISSLCPTGTMCLINGSKVELTFLLPCTGKLGNVSTKTETDDAGNSKLYVSAVSITPKETQFAQCLVATFAKYQVTLPSIFLTKEDIVDLNSKN